MVLLVLGVSSGVVDEESFATGELCTDGWGAILLTVDFGADIMLVVALDGSSSQAPTPLTSASVRLSHLEALLYRV